MIDLRSSNIQALIRTTGPRLASAVLALSLLSFAAAAGAAGAAGGGNSAQAEARYHQERARCLSGQSGQDRATCLREAGAALSEARHGRLGNGSASYAENALNRCKAQAPADQPACRARMDGAGVTSGSVAGGGILREYREIEKPAASETGETAPGTAAPDQISK